MFIAYMPLIYQRAVAGITQQQIEIQVPQLHT